MKEHGLHVSIYRHISIKKIIIGIVFCALSHSYAQEPFPGNPPIVPRWAFEPWVWEDNTNTRTSAENLIKGYTDRKIPVGAVVIDSPWETYLNNCIFDLTRYANPQEMINAFHAKNIKVIMWITGFVNTNDPNHAYVVSHNYAVNNNIDLTWWKGTGVHIDHTNPAARTWWHTVLDNVMNLGIDGWKVDQSADYVPDSIITSIGKISQHDFKKYYHADMFDYTTAKNPNAITIARAYASTQGGVGASVSKVSMGWQGDFYGDFGTRGVPLQVHDVYKAAILGYGCVGVEIGGYFGTVATKNSLIRYTQFAAMTSLMENGGSNGGLAQHLPWYWDTTTVTIYRYFATLHSELAPYNFSYGVEAHITGTSALRNVDTTKNHHTLGNDIFASAITSDVLTKTIYFPSGSVWIDYWDETKTYQGGTSVAYSTPLDKYPIFIRSGAIIPLNVKNAVTGHGDSTNTGKTTVLIYPNGESQFVFHRPVGDGVAYKNVTITVNQSAGTIHVAGDTAVSYQLRIKYNTAPATVSGADTWAYDSSKKKLIINKTGSDYTITISNTTKIRQDVPAYPQNGIAQKGSVGFIEVFDISGRCVFTANHRISKNALSENYLKEMCNALPAGIYYYRVKENGIIMQKSVKLVITR